MLTLSHCICLAGLMFSTKYQIGLQLIGISLVIVLIKYWTNQHDDLMMVLNEKWVDNQRYYNIH